MKEGGSLKLTEIGGELYITTDTALGTLDLTNYKEVYFYAWAQSSGAMGGTWWCNDTVLAAGKWTKITVYRDANLNINGGNHYYDADGASGKLFAEGSTGSNFVFRIMGGQNNTIYITSLYGVPYAEVDVTVDDAVKAYVTVEGTFKEGQTITISRNGAPAGKEFAYFTVNGERLDGATYTLGTEDVVVGAVFTEITTLTLGNGITTSDGETQYARGITVTLAFDESATPNGKLFNYFTVDGERIVGNTFETVDATHAVAAVFADSAEELTWITSEEAQGSAATYNWSAYNFSGKAVGESTHWAIEAKAYGFTGLGDKWYSLDFLVGDNASLQIRLHSAGNAFIYAMGANHSDGTNLIALDASVIALCKAATEEAPVAFTAIRNGDTYYVLINGALVLKTQFAFNVSGNKFGIGGTDCGAWLTDHPAAVYKYRTGEELAEYMAAVNVTGTKVAFDHANGVYTLGDTVTLTHDPAEQGLAFSHYTVDGKAINGNSFVANKNSYTVEAIFAEISTLTLGEGVSTADGETQYARGVSVRLLFDSEKLNGKVVDYYLIDKDTEHEIRVYHGEFTTTAATHTVEAVLVAPGEMTWANGGADYGYETVMGDSAAEWKARELDGEVYGSAEYWAVSVDVKFTDGWKSVEFIQGSNQSIRVRFHSSGFFGVILMTGKTDETDPSPEFIHAWPNKNVQVVNKLLAVATVT
ncbi:MAG: hypothetical protein K2H43_00220 [Clostridia bacterium]|nr:hypothetical protein [Clostridia bacterium]